MDLIEQELHKFNNFAFTPKDTIEETIIKTTNNDGYILLPEISESEDEIQEETIQEQDKIEETQRIEEHNFEEVEIIQEAKNHDDTLLYIGIGLVFTGLILA